MDKGRYPCDVLTCTMKEGQKGEGKRREEKKRGREVVVVKDVKRGKNMKNLDLDKNIE